MRTFAEIVASRAQDDGVGLRFEESSWTWREVVAESCARAALMAQVVPEPPDRQVHVGVLLENVPDYVFWIGAGALSGAVVVGVNASRSGPELARDIAHSDVDLLIVDDASAARLEGLALSVPSERVLNIDSAEYAEQIRSCASVGLPEDEPAADDIALLLFSSGSTGAPKAVIVSHGRLGSLTSALIDRVRMRPDSVTYLCMPLFHGNAVMLNLATAMATGATVAMTRRFSARGFAPDVHRYGVTFVNYVGRALSYVLSTPVSAADATSTLELAFGTEASEADAARFAERFGCEVMEGYGMSEGVFRINRTPQTPSGSLGLPVGVDVRILDEETGVECPRAVFDEHGRLANPEAVGQMVAIGAAGSFEGYYRNPEAMADRVRGDDFWSGDLAYRDAEGWFWFAGRSSDWLRVDSENFAAAPLERLFQRADGVAVAPVFAVPDPVTGDQVMCAIELEPGAVFDPAAFAEFLAGEAEMSEKWWPRFLRVVERVPLTGSNKIDKAPLRAEAWLGAGPTWMRVGRSHEYVVVDDAARAELAAEFAQHGRAALLPG